MNEQHNIEDILRDKIAGAERTPPAQVWDGIKTHLDKNKSQPWVPIFIIASTVALIVIGALLYNSDSSALQDSPKYSSQSSQSTEQPISQKTNSSENETAVLNDGVENGNENNSRSLNDKQLRNKNSDNKGRASKEEKSVNRNSSINQDKSSLTKNENPSTSSIKNTDESNVTTSSESGRLSNENSETNSQSTSISKSTSSKIAKKSTSNSSSENEVIEDKRNNSQKSGKNIENQANNQANNQADSENSLSETNLADAQEDKKALRKNYSIEKLKFDKDYKKIETQSSDQDNIYKTPCEILKPGLCKKFLQERQLSAFAEARVGIGMGSRTLSVSSPIYNDLLRNKRELESSLHTESYALRLGLLWQKGISVTSGIELHKQWEKYRYEDKYAVIQEPIIEYDTVNVGGEQEIREDTISPVTVGKYTHQNYNKITSIDIPFIVGYEKPIGNWIFSVNGGLYLNLTQQVTGKVAGFNKKPASIGSETIQYSYKTDMGIGFYGGLGISYYLDKGWEIGIHPRLRYNPSSLTTDESILSQKYLQFNVSIGLRRYF